MMPTPNPRKSMPLDLTPILDSRITDQTKGVPGGTAPFALRDIAAQGWNVLREDLPLPLMVLRQSALLANATVMQQYTAAAGVDLAPHGKTTMAPQLFDLQLRTGSWGITAATADQVLVMRRHGVQRIILANQLVGRANVAAVVQELNADASFDFYCLVDSPELADRLAADARDAGLTRPIQVLLEAGAAGKRTGCRDHATATATLQAIRRHPGILALAGIEGFEGVLPDAAAVDQFLAFTVSLVDLLEPGDLEGRSELLLTAGGSAYFDRVVAAFTGVTAPIPTRIVLRSGCYLTHDSGIYDQLMDATRSRGWRHTLQPALEAWCAVQSRPDPDLAVLTMGKRDVPYDSGLPVPLRIYRRGQGFLPAPAGELIGTNDQHGMWRIPADADLQVGDLVACGISHPCTAFDKWRLIPVVDDDYTVIDGILTYF